MFGELLRGLAAAAAPASGRGSRRGRPGVLPERGQFGAGGVKVALGALGAGVQGDSKKDQRARAQVLHEMQRRDDEAAARKSREHAKFPRQLEQSEAVENAYVHAEAATRGHMLNAKGRARGINPRTLITGREADFRRYASDELAEYFATHHRPTAASFRGADTRVHPVATEPKRRQ